MWVAALEVTDFRSYRQARVDLPEGPVVLLGPNGQGKTNLVEAIGYAAGLESHRVSGDRALVRNGADQAIIRVTALVAGRETLIELEINPGRANRARLNGSRLPRVRDVLGVLRCVTFAPEDLHLVKGDPVERRGFLDGLMVQAAPRYAAVRSDFDKALRQRNALLRSAGTWSARDITDTLAAWDGRYLPLAAELTWGRVNAVRRLTAPSAAAYREISPAPDDVVLDYAPAAPGLAEAGTRDEVQACLAAASAQRRSEELRRGITLVGPHRDDVAITLNQMPAKSHASHGECWSIALALRLASFAVLTTISDEPPALILDDVFAELDESRRSRLVAALGDANQIIVTAAVPADVPRELSGKAWQVLKRDAISEIAPLPDIGSRG